MARFSWIRTESTDMKTQLILLSLAWTSSCAAPLSTPTVDRLAPLPKSDSAVVIEPESRSWQDLDEIDSGTSSDQGESEKGLYAIDQYALRGGKICAFVDPVVLFDPASSGSGSGGGGASSPAPRRGACGALR